MLLLSQLWNIWNRLHPAWKSYLAEAGLGKVSEASFAKDLQREIRINFKLSGLEDLCRDTKRAIEPGDPALSLLYHVLASPGVLPEDLPDCEFPSWEDIEIVENYIYSIARRSFKGLQKEKGRGKLAIAVFALEYCPASETPHKLHADLCFSRTGVARIGSVAPKYVRKARGFTPRADRVTDVAVVPCRYAAFLAKQVPLTKRDLGAEYKEGDGKRRFWIPMHKLFNGGECLVDVPELKVYWEAYHANMKIRKVQEGVESAQKGTASAFGEVLTLPPYTIVEGLATLDRSSRGTCLLSPVPHCPMVHPAMRDDATGKAVYATFLAPPGHDGFLSSLYFKPQGTISGHQSCSFPEYVHVRHELKTEAGDSSHIVNRPVAFEALWNKLPPETYEAVHFVDYTGDGWVRASCGDMLPISILSAYSILAQPDFFPFVRQQDLFEWWKNTVPPELKDHIWQDDSSPSSLASARFPPNLTLQGTGFDRSEDTISAVVTPLRKGGACPPFSYPVRRESILPFRSADVLQPGWDIGLDTTDKVPHLANYSLGSPFPEDAMICAGEGAFWPAAVPDTARMFRPGNNMSVTPLLDEEIGLPGREWDRAPRPEWFPMQKAVRYIDPSAVDYVSAVWRCHLEFGKFMDIDLGEYTARTLVMARVFHLLNALTPLQRAAWGVISFTKNLGELPPRVALSGTYRYKIQMFEGTSWARCEDFRRVDVTYEQVSTFYATPEVVFQDSIKLWGK